MLGKLKKCVRLVVQTLRCMCGRHLWRDVDEETIKMECVHCGIRCHGMSPWEL